MTTQDPSTPHRGWLAALPLLPGTRQHTHTDRGHRVTPAPLRRRSPGDRDAPERVQFRRVMTRTETLLFAIMLSGVLWLTARYAVWWFQLDHLPRNYGGAVTALVIAANVLPFTALTILEGLRTLQLLVFWFFACFMADAVPLPAPSRLRVAILTTIVPSKEPPEAVEATLAAMSRIRYAGPLDLWILDEEDDPRVHAMAQRYGILHFTRHDIARYNQPSGPFKAKTKSGNLNAWLDSHRARGQK